MKRIVRLLPRFRQAKRELEILRDRESWSREQISRWQLDKINGVWRTAIHNVPYYREIFQTLNLPKQFESLQHFSESVPVVEKAAVREQPLRFLSSHPSPGKWLRTSGSTGIYTRVYWENSAHHEMLRCKYRGEQAWGLNIFDPKALLWGATNTCSSGLWGKIERKLEPVLDGLRCRKRLSAYRLSECELQSHVEELKKFKAVSLYGYSTAILLLAKYVESTGDKLPDLKLAIMTGETADQAMVAQCQQALGCGVAVEYGSVECGLLAYRYPDGELHVREDHIFMETVSRADGLFDILVTVLNNPSFPLIRYRIGDTSIAPLVVPDCGFAHITKLAGRENDLMISKSGRSIHSMAIKHTIENYPNVRRFRAIQQEDGSLNVEVETEVTDLSQFERCAEMLKDWLDGFPVHLKLSRELSSSESGKHRWIYTNYRPASDASGKTAAAKIGEKETFQESIHCASTHSCNDKN